MKSSIAWLMALGTFCAGACGNADNDLSNARPKRTEAPAIDAGSKETRSRPVQDASSESDGTDGDTNAEATLQTPHDADALPSHDADALPSHDADALPSHDADALPSHDADATGSTQDASRATDSGTTSDASLTDPDTANAVLGDAGPECVLFTRVREGGEIHDGSCTYFYADDCEGPMRGTMSYCGESDPGVGIQYDCLCEGPAAGHLSFTWNNAAVGTPFVGGLKAACEYVLAVCQP